LLVVICLFNVLHLDVEELAWVEWPDHELGPAHLSLPVSQRLGVLQVVKFLLVPIIDIIREVKAVLDLDAVSSEITRGLALGLRLR